MKTKIISLIIIVTILILLTGCRSNLKYDMIQLERSTNHQVNGTWWGINQVKIVRFKDIVYTYYMENENLIEGDPNRDNPSEVKLVRINENLQTREFDTLYSSRPVTLAVDSVGRLQVCVFEPTSSNDNGSIGKLVLYTYTFDELEKFKRTEEVIVDNDGTEQTANVRFSMAIDKQDNIMIGYGQGYYENEEMNYAITAFIRASGTTVWQHERLAENLGEENYYPYLIINSTDDLMALAVQDACYLEMTQFDYPCFYQYVRYFYDGTYKTIVDYSHLEIAKERPQLIENIGFFHDGKGRTHMITRAWIDEAPNQFKGTFDYFVEADGEFERQPTDYLDTDFNWLRFFEYEDKVYMVGLTYSKLAIIDPGNKKTIWIDVDKRFITSSYLFTNTTRGGSTTDKYLDLYIIPADVNQYGPTSVYLRFELDEVVKHLN